jgi:glycosyltransferase involved in cell wall biosynthesis
VVDGFTDSLDPIKLYEYLAVGRPVVSTPVAGFRDQPADRVTTASPQSLADAVVRVLAEHRPAGLGEAPADVPRWSDRVREMQAVLDRVRTSR